MKVKVGIIGAGLIAQHAHIPYIKEIDRYELRALCDIAPGLAETVGKNFSIPGRYVDHVEMLRKEDLDAVVVCSSDESHHVASVDASEAGCHVLVEKPIALSVKAADLMVKAAEKAGRVLMMAYMKRYDPGYEAGARLMNEAGEDIVLIRVHDFPNGIGAPEHSIFAVLNEATRRVRLPKEIVQRSMNEAEKIVGQQLGEFTSTEMNAWRVLLGFGAHDMTILRGVFGSPHGVLASTIIPGITSKMPVETFYTTKIISLLEYGNAKCVFAVGGTQSTWFDEELAAFGNNQTISIRFPYPWIKNEPTIVTRTKTSQGGFEKSVLTASYEESYKQEHKHFINCIEKNEPPRTSGLEGKRDLEALYSILEKARKK